MMRPLPTLRQDRGLTLVEVLIGIAMGSIAAAVLFATFLGSRDVYVKNQTETNVHGDAQAVLGLLANEIRAAGSDATELGLTGRGVAMASSDSLHLVSDLDGDGTIGVTEPPEDVVYAYDRAAGTLTRDTGTGPVVLLEGIESLDLRYLDANNQALPAGGNGHVDPDSLRAVEITLSVRKPDGTTENLTRVYAFRAR